MTVHKSQGSQARHVTVLLPPDDSPLLTRELLYTAVTRARESVTVVGTPEKVRAGLLEKAREYGVDEFVCVTICYDHGDRLRSYELLAQAFELQARAAA